MVAPSLPSGPVVEGHASYRYIGRIALDSDDPCPAHGRHHQAWRERPADWPDQDRDSHDRPEWPTHCACGASLADAHKAHMARDEPIHPSLLVPD